MCNNDSKIPFVFLGPTFPPENEAFWRLRGNHIFPKIPCHNLKAFHQLVKDQMPYPKKGVIDAYKSIIPAIFKQAKDKNYFIDVEMPSTN